MFHDQNKWKNALPGKAEEEFCCRFLSPAPWPRFSLLLLRFHKGKGILIRTLFLLSRMVSTYVLVWYSNHEIRVRNRVTKFYFGFQQKFSHSPCIIEIFCLTSEFNIPNRRFGLWIHWVDIKNTQSNSTSIFIAIIATVKI